MSRSKDDVRDWKKNKKLGGLPLYSDCTFKKKPTRHIKDPTPHFAFRKEKNASGAYGYGSPHPHRSTQFITRRQGMFRNRIREKRQEVGLSQTQLACRIGMAESTLSNLELGKWKPWPKAKRNISKVLGVSQRELFPEND